MLALSFIFYTIWWYFEYKDGLMAGISSLLVLTAFFNGIIWNICNILLIVYLMFKGSNRKNNIVIQS